MAPRCFASARIRAWGPHSRLLPRAARRRNSPAGSSQGGSCWCSRRAWTAWLRMSRSRSSSRRSSERQNTWSVMTRHFVLVVAGISLGCAKPLPSPPVPAFHELGTYADAARSFSGCWVLRLAAGEPYADFARLVILELDTTVAGPARPDASPELRAYGRGGVPRYRGNQRPEYFWHVTTDLPDTADIAVGGLSFPGWRLTPAGDSLVGRMYDVWDVGGVETDGGF